MKGFLLVVALERRTGTGSRARLSVLTAVLTFALGGCSGGLGALITKSPGTAYDLAAATSFPGHVGRTRGQLVIAEPTSLAPLDGDRILVRPIPGQVAALGDAQWEDRLPKLVHTRLLQSFENASRLRTVGRPSDKITTDFALLTELRSFEISVADGAAVVEIAVKIVNERSGRIVAARLFRATVPANASEGAPAVAALNEAFTQVAAQLVLWAVKVV